MSINVGNATPAKLVPASTEDQGLINVKNTGANPVMLSKTSSATFATGSYSLAAATGIQVSLNPGEELYGICSSGLTSTVDVI